MRVIRFGPAVAAPALLVISLGGCAVPQRQGKGLCQRLVEPETNTAYWLYLPEDYVKNNGRAPDSNRRWPVVVTFHGLKPYDNANPQVREWQEEADRYGFIVIAPELRTCDSLTMQFPLRDPSLPYVQKDEQAVIAIMDEVFRRTNADPSRVLSTSFSSGGYIAHFIVNRYPERFSCIAVRGSNFSESLLNPAQVPKYRDMKIGIFFGENDFKACREESMRAVEWYRRYRFDVQAKKVGGLGHERRPQVAAALFAATIGVTPKTPPELGALVMLDVMPVARYRPVSRRGVARRPPAPPPAPRTGSRTGSGPPAVSRRGPQTDQNLLFKPKERATPEALRPGPTRVAPIEPGSRRPTPVRAPPTRGATRRRPVAQPYSSPVTPAPRTERRTRTDRIPARERAQPAAETRIQVHGDTVGVAPMWVSLSLDTPESLRDGASVLWTDNGRPIGAGTFATQSILRHPGDHVIEARIITAEDHKIVLRQTMKVLPAPSSQPAGG